MPGAAQAAQQRAIIIEHRRERAGLCGCILIDAQDFIGEARLVHRHAAKSLRNRGAAISRQRLFRNTRQLKEKNVPGLLQLPECSQSLLRKCGMRDIHDDQP